MSEYAGKSKTVGATAGFHMPIIAPVVANKTKATNALPDNE
jgi:hypothetical protein